MWALGTQLDDRWYEFLREQTTSYLIHAHSEALAARGAGKPYTKRLLEIKEDGTNHFVVTEPTREDVLKFIAISIHRGMHGNQVSHFHRRVEQEDPNRVEGGWRCDFGVHRATPVEFQLHPKYLGNKKGPWCVHCYNFLRKGTGASNARYMCLTCGKGLCGTHWMTFPPHRAYFKLIEQNGIKLDAEGDF